MPCASLTAHRPKPEGALGTDPGHRVGALLAPLQEARHRNREGTDEVFTQPGARSWPEEAYPTALVQAGLRPMYPKGLPKLQAREGRPHQGTPWTQ